MISRHRPSLSRRGFCLCCMAAFAGGSAWLSPREAFAAARNVVDGFRADAAKADIQIHKLRGNVSVLEGSGGNIAVLTGSDGKVMIDAGITATRPRIVAALEGLGPMPVSHLINTHWHFDHADGNEWIGGNGVAIIAHANTRKHLTEAQRVEDWDFNFPPAPPAAVPTEVVEQQKSLKLNRQTLNLQHLPLAHTDGDLTVTFAEADIIHTGDIYWAGMYPFIDYSTGGNIDGTIRAADAVLAQAGKGTIIIPGHGGPVSDAAGLKTYRDMLATSRDRVAALKSKGHTLEEIVAARPTAEFDAVFGQAVVPPAFFTKLVFEGV
jgi:glyoxylase-like metal-dependent hydrolase (beta-lactamase superfamily II)